MWRIDPDDAETISENPINFIELAKVGRRNLARRYDAQIHRSVAASFPDLEYGAALRDWQDREREVRSGF